MIPEQQPPIHIYSSPSPSILYIESDGIAESMYLMNKQSEISTEQIKFLLQYGSFQKQFDIRFNLFIHILDTKFTDKICNDGQDTKLMDSK